MVINRSAALAVAGCLLAACSSPTQHVAGPATPTPSVSGPGAHACPTPEPAEKGGAAAVDYVDFVRLDGRMYIAEFGRPRHAPPPTLGHEVGAVRCELSAIGPGLHSRSRNGDAAFLPAGTQLLAITGWPVRCRIAVSSVEGKPRVYVALRPGTPARQATNCPAES